MVLLFNYTGSINGSQMAGSGSLTNDPSTGRFIGGASFNAFPASFNPAAVGVSLLSLSCTNGSYSGYGQPNILSLSSGSYSSIRTVNLKSSGGVDFGTVTLNGSFTQVSPELYTANVVVSGTYSGPTDLILPEGYDMSLTPVGNSELDGDFSFNVSTSGGDYITAHNHQQFIFAAPTQTPTACEINLFYDQDINWNSQQNGLYVAGVTVIRP